MLANIPVTVAKSGTTGDFLVPGGYRLIGFWVPTMDSTTLDLTISDDGGSTFRAVEDTDGTDITGFGGTADTGAKFVRVPDNLGDLTEGRTCRLTVAAQTTAARSLIAICRATGGGG